MSTPLRDAVQLWYLHERDVDDVQAAAYLDLLTADEVERYHRFRCESAQRQFLLARGLLRSTLSRYVPVDPQAWRFATNGHGKPFVVAPQTYGLQFNVSHTRGMVCCAITQDRDVGVDVEWLDRRVNLGIADRYFAPSEVDQLRRAPQEEQQRVFLRFWTLKESYIKARGLGLAIPLSDFWFDLPENHPPSVTVAASQNDRSDRWQFFEQEFTSKHRLAVAVEERHGRFPEVMCHRAEVCI